MISYGIDAIVRILLFFDGVFSSENLKKDMRFMFMSAEVA
jgi:hypothetical protein